MQITVDYSESKEMLVYIVKTPKYNYNVIGHNKNVIGIFVDFSNCVFDAFALYKGVDNIRFKCLYTVASLIAAVQSSNDEAVRYLDGNVKMIAKFTTKLLYESSLRVRTKSGCSRLFSFDLSQTEAIGNTETELQCAVMQGNSNEFLIAADPNSDQYLVIKQSDQERTFQIDSATLHGSSSIVKALLCAMCLDISIYGLWIRDVAVSTAEHNSLIQKVLRSNDIATPINIQLYGHDLEMVGWITCGSEQYKVVRARYIYDGVVEEQAICYSVNAFGDQTGTFFYRLPRALTDMRFGVQLSTIAVALRLGAGSKIDDMRDCGIVNFDKLEWEQSETMNECSKQINLLMFKDGYALIESDSEISWMLTCPNLDPSICNAEYLTLCGSADDARHGQGRAVSNSLEVLCDILDGVLPDNVINLSYLNRFWLHKHLNSDMNEIASVVKEESHVF